MPTLGRVGRQLTSYLWRATIAEEVDAELEFHVAMTTRELVARGLSESAARAEAIRRFGDIAAVNATCRRLGTEREHDMRRTQYLAELRQDIAYALRQLTKARSFTAVAVLTLALGIGATTAIFSAVQSVVLRRFPFAHPDRTTFVMERWQDRDGNVSVGNFTDWKRMSRSFSAMGAINFGSFNLAEGDAPQRVLGGVVSDGFFDVFGVRPALGRLFTREEDQPGQEQVVVLSDQLWRGQFAADRGIVGRSVRLNGREYRVVGVMPASFDPTLSQEQLWVPAAFTAASIADHDRHFLNVVALLAPNVTVAQAQAEMTRIATVLRERYPQDNGARTARVAALPELLIGNLRQRLFVLLGAVGFVLLIACGNVANLLLARGAVRAKEMAIRAAIGAGRGRLIRQLLTESLVLAAAAAVVGLALAQGLIKVLVANAPVGIPRLGQTRIDWVVLAFALGVAAVSSIIFGFVPALRTARQDLQSVLKEGGRGAGSARDVVRSTLIIGEVALALTLLTGAGLLIRSAIYLQRVTPGFDPTGVLATRVALPAAGYGDPEHVRQTFEQIIERVSASPGVVAAAAVSQAPLGPGGNSNGLFPEGQKFDPQHLVDARLRMITPGYFATMRVPLRRGRLFDARDVRGSSLAIIVSETLARRLWPNEDAIGKRVACCEGSPEDPKWKTVVGIVGDVRSGGPTVDIRPEFYLPVAQAPAEAWDWVQRTMSIVARTNGPEAGVLTAPIRSALRQVDPALPLYGIITMRDALDRSMAQARFNTMLLGTLGTIGLLLAALGIYSVISYFVSLRTHEIGVRMALGATTGDVVRLMTWQGMRPIAIGVVLGAVTAFATTRLLATSLYGVSATDPMTFAGVVAVLVVVGLAATLVPASRATKVEPTKALNA
jgi:putative ABC transport system permease protein